MARRKGPITKAVKEALQVPAQIDVPPEIAKILDAYLAEQIPIALRERDEILPRVEKWRRTIRGERATPTTKRGRTMSNISVPLLIWARVAVRARLTESILENKQILTIESLRPREAGVKRSPQTPAKAIGRFLTAEILNPRGLNGHETVTKIASELVDIGTSAMMIAPTEGSIKHAAPLPGQKKPQLVPLHPQVRWRHVSYLNLVYVDGYGTDTQAMPFVGHQIEQSWNEIETWGRLGHYDERVLEGIKAAARDGEGRKPLDLQNHDLIELYMDWDINGDGVQEALLITWHEKTKRRLRTTWNRTPDGYRPILMAQFDLPDDITKGRGQGVSEKLEGAQDEVDIVHNIAIEAGKRGIAHVIVLKEGTRAEEEFGGEQDIFPGDIIVTGTPDEDVKGIPLGDPQAALVGIQIEEHTRLYVSRILGLDEARMGNVSAGKRVSATVGMASMQEGRIITKNAVGSLSRMLNEASYLTLDWYKIVPPRAALDASLKPEDVEALMSTVFSLDAKSTRTTFSVRVNAQDAAIAGETRKQEVLMLNQALFPFYDRINQLILALENPQLSPTAKKGMVMLVERMERGVEALLNSVESIPNPDELMVNVGELVDLLEANVTEEAPDDLVGAGAEDSLVGDLGAGVA